MLCAPCPPTACARYNPKPPETRPPTRAQGLAAATGVLANTNPYIEMLLVDCDKLRCGAGQRRRRPPALCMYMHM